MTIIEKCAHNILFRYWSIVRLVFVLSFVDFQNGQRGIKEKHNNFMDNLKCRQPLEFIGQEYTALPCVNYSVFTTKQFSIENCINAYRFFQAFCLFVGWAQLVLCWVFAHIFPFNVQIDKSIRYFYCITPCGQIYETKLEKRIAILQRMHSEHSFPNNHLLLLQRFIQADHWQ